MFQSAPPPLSLLRGPPAQIINVAQKNLIKKFFFVGIQNDNLFKKAMNKGLIELAALSAPDDAWILVEATSSMDAYEFGKIAAGTKTNCKFMTKKKASADKSLKSSNDLMSMKKGYTVGFYQNQPTKEAGK